MERKEEKKALSYLWNRRFPDLAVLAAGSSDQGDALGAGPGVVRLAVRAGADGAEGAAVAARRGAATLGVFAGNGTANASVSKRGNC